MSSLQSASPTELRAPSQQSAYAGHNARVYGYSPLLALRDDCALNTKEDMQRSMDLFPAGCANFGLTINTAKMVVMRQLPPSAEYNAPESMSTNTEVEMARQDPGHGSPRENRNPQHPRHVEASANAFAFTTTTISSDGDSLLNCPQCDRTFPSLTHSRDRHLHCPHCPRAFTHRVGLFGHMRIYDSGHHRSADNTDTPCTPFAPAILTATATPTTMNNIPQHLPISPAHTAPATSFHASA
ncbi:unnamed protein product [Schistocephalus solidus]|uniref:C2H2-type domain-containing protein n=1 Tax=Schistocephalus solidus TaxID=70667 RepID=A0A183SWP6_SCHSO|nr:unnamed protein product [Schistocephalus solidus]